MAGGAGARRGPQGPTGPQQNQGGNFNGPPPGYNNNGNFNGPPPGYNQNSGFGGPPAGFNNNGGHNGGPPSKPRSGGFDGPGEPSRGPNPFGPGLGYDPAKPKIAEKKVITNSRVELPASAYKLEGGNVSSMFYSAVLVFALQVWSFEFSGNRHFLLSRSSGSPRSQLLYVKLLATRVAEARAFRDSGWGSCPCLCLSLLSMMK